MDVLSYDIGCVFVRDADAHRRAFATAPGYLSRTTAGPASHSTNFSDLGIELTRRFRALKVWLTLKAHGVEAFAEQIRKNVSQAAYLASLVDTRADLELAAPVAVNVVCFRCVPPGRAPEDLDRLNHDLLIRLQTSGIALPSHTVLNGRFVIRAAITNHRSVYSDFDVLVDAVARFGAEANDSMSADLEASRI